MKPIFLILTFLIPFIVWGESEISSTEYPLFGTWVLDVAKTKENRKNLKELPAGMDIMPKPEDVRFRMLTFTADTLFSGPTASEHKTAYRIIKKRGSRVLVEYSGSNEETTVYCWWDLPSPDTAISYVAVFDLNDPLLGSKNVASYYNKKPYKTGDDNSR